MTVHTTFPLQDHIHLALTLGAGPENAPVLKWGITDRAEIPEVLASFERAITGKPLISFLPDGIGNPKQFLSYRYLVVVKDPGGDDSVMQGLMAQLQSMQSRLVYLCDSYHPNGGVDHTSAVRQMYLAKVSEFPVFNPSLLRYYVTVDLKDADT